MKKFFFFILFYLLFPAPFSFAEETEYYLPDIKHTRRCPSGYYQARMTGFYDNPPFAWAHYEEGKAGGQSYMKMHGLGFDLAQLIIERIGDIRQEFFTIYDFSQAKAYLAKNAIDLLVTAYFERDDTPDLQYVYPAYVSNPIVVMTLRSSKKILKVDDLVNLKGGVSASEETFKILKTIYPNLKLQEIGNYKNTLLMLNKKEIDYVLTGMYTAEAQTRRFRVENYITLTDPITHIKVFMILSEKSCVAEFKGAFNEMIAKWVDDKEDRTIRDALFNNIDLYARQKRIRNPLFATKPTYIQNLLRAKEAEDDGFRH